MSSLLATSVAGVICGFLAIVLSIGHGTLLFSTNFRIYLPVSIGLALFSTTVVAAIGARTSSTPGVVAIAQEIPVVALTAVVTSVASALPAGVSDIARLTTIMAAIGIATVCTGIAAVALGHFRLGSLIRFAPYPVVGGFLAGTGWLIATGGLALIADGPASDLVHHLNDPQTLMRLGLTAAFAAALVAGQVRSSSPFSLPLVILAGLLVFNVSAFLANADTAALRAQGWLVRMPEGGRLWPPIGLSDLENVDWTAVAAGLVAMPAVILLTIAALLMNATGIELDQQRDSDLDRELKSVGLMNLAAGAGVGLPGYHTVSLTILASRLGAPNRWVGFIVAGFAGAALLLGHWVLDFVPTVVLGGVLIWIGGGLMVEWLVRSYRRVGLGEYVVITLIFAIIVGVDFALGILAGLVAAVVLFVLEYGRLDVIRLETTGARFQSSAEAPRERREALQKLGDAILIMSLQGFLFFGTADKLRRHLQARVANPEERPIRHLLIDFSRVNGIDSSSVSAFTRLQQFAAQQGFDLVLTAVSKRQKLALIHGGVAAPGSRVRFDVNLERGLRWCEDQLLTALESQFEGKSTKPVRELLLEIVEEPAVADMILSYCQRAEFGPGQYLIHQGASADSIVMIESGHAGVEEEPGEGRSPTRLASIGPGSIIGEMGFYLQEQRSASVIAEDQMVVWVLSNDALQRLQAERPLAASKLHQNMAKVLARRLAQADRLIGVLAD